jgi:hypothetical protein
MPKKKAKKPPKPSEIELLNEEMKRPVMPTSVREALSKRKKPLLASEPKIQLTIEIVPLEKVPIKKRVKRIGTA